MNPTDDEIRKVWNRTQDPIATVRAFLPAGVTVVQPTRSQFNKDEPFIIDANGVLRWSDGSCRPASAEEQALWNALHFHGMEGKTNG